MYQLMDYARTHSDNGKFFVLDEAQHFSAVCFFEHGKPLRCWKETQYSDMKVEDFSTLMR
jgi:hypothetical protein